MSEQASGSYRLPTDCSSGVMDVCSANSCRERWVILRIPSIQASQLQLFIWGQSPQIAQPSVLHNMSLYPVVYWSDVVVCQGWSTLTVHPSSSVHLFLTCLITEFQFRKCIGRDVQMRFVCLLKILKSLWLQFTDSIICWEKKQGNKYSFELESLESVSLISSRVAAGCASFFSLPNLLKEDFFLYHF